MEQLMWIKAHNFHEQRQKTYTTMNILEEYSPTTENVHCTGQALIVFPFLLVFVMKEHSLSLRFTECWRLRERLKRSLLDMLSFKSYETEKESSKSWEKKGKIQQEEENPVTAPETLSQCIRKVISGEGGVG